MDRRALFLLASALVLFATTGAALEPRRPNQESFLLRAVYAEGRLWTLSDAGDLSSLAEEDGAPRTESLDEPAEDLCRHAGHPLVATCARDGCNRWTLREHRGTGWISGPAIQTQSDELIGLSCSEDNISLLTSHRLLEVENGKVHAVALSETLRAGGVTSIYRAGNGILVGANQGEWGGGLRRVDRHSGAVTTIEKNVDKSLCGGPLNTECDPVNGIARDPWKPDCAIVAIGLIHFISHGRLLRLCEDEVNVLFEAASAEGWSFNSGKGPPQTVAFFGVAADSNTLVAAGNGGLYRIDGKAASQFKPLPPFKTVGNLTVSFAVPGFILVLTDINSRRSVSGRVPILVER